MDTIELKMVDENNIKFEGELLGSVTSHIASKLRWTELYVYKTVSGKYVCYSVGKTLLSNEKDRCSYAIFDEITDISNFFGFTWLAKHLYSAINLDVALKIH